MNTAIGQQTEQAVVLALAERLQVVHSMARSREPSAGTEDASHEDMLPPPSRSASPLQVASASQHQGPGVFPRLRALPNRNITEETIDDAFVAFILYANPYFPLDIDTSALRRLFRSPPKSDGREYSTLTLFQLIKKLDAKEIKTWAQLSLELGVEPPTAENGGSNQKVQQYSVRLKVGTTTPLRSFPFT